VFRFQDLATRLPDTRNLTPDTYTVRQLINSTLAATQGPLSRSEVPEKLEAFNNYFCAFRGRKFSKANL